MYVGLAGDVVHNIPDVLLPAAPDEVLLGSSVLQERTQNTGRLISLRPSGPAGLLLRLRTW